MKFKRLKSKILLIEHKIKSRGNLYQIDESTSQPPQRNIKRNGKYWY